MGANQRIGIVINSSAGSASDEALINDVHARFSDAEFFDPEDGFDQALHAASNCDVMAMVGGDGSMNAAAAVAVETGTPLLVIPGGTLNHFARDLGIDSVADAAEALEAGRQDLVDVGYIDGEVFVNTASFGSYPQLVDERERHEDSIGKWPAMAVALWRAIRSVSPTEVSIDGHHTKVWLFFAGNCSYDPPGLAPMSRASLHDGWLDIRWIDADVPFARTRTFFAVLSGPRGWSRAVRRRMADRVVIESHEGPLRLARDGETFDGGTRIVIEKRPGALSTYRGES